MNTRLIMTNVILIFVLVNFLDISRASRLAARQPQNSVFRYANNPQQSDIVRVTILPYYGGAKGQSLQIVTHENGTTFMSIIPTPANYTADVNTIEVENPPLPSRSEFQENLRNVHSTAFNMIKLQQLLNSGGDEDARLKNQAAYDGNLAQLQESAQNLAESAEGREGLSSWLDRKKIQANKEKEESGEDTAVVDENSDDGVEINIPSDDTSVAEAKPIALAIAGEGGVAASKPVATAVVGPGGLAIARPVGTAIAGVSPEQSLVPLYAESAQHTASKPSRKPTNKEDFLSKLIAKYHREY